MIRIKILVQLHNHRIALVSRGRVLPREDYDFIDGLGESIMVSRPWYTPPHDFPLPALTARVPAATSSGTPNYPSSCKRHSSLPTKP